MNATVQKALDTVENRLQELIESIASYNPSPAAASALIEADNELEETLEQLDEHQQAYRHILSLRETSKMLDEQLTELLTTLAETRQQVISVPSTKFSVQPREIPFDQLLSYATKIAKYSRPPNPTAFKKYADTVLPPPPPPPQLQEGESKPAEPENAEKLPLGLTQEDMVNTDPLGGMPPFMPWPNEIVMRQGALA
ncbi:mediator complex, subunit Med4, partial [Sphaerosporella brunnea]